MADGSPARKKIKAPRPPPEVLTFGISHSPVRVQLLRSHTVDDLCDAFCEYTTIGNNEASYDHMWNVRDGAGRGFESDFMETEKPLSDLALFAPNATLRWSYDYGAGHKYLITLLNISPLADGLSEDDFPRKVAVAAPAGYAKYSPPQDLGVNLDLTFAHLNTWAFVEGEGVALNFFQPPHKNNHGWLDRDGTTAMYPGNVRHMVLMPAAPPKDIAAYLHCLDVGVLGKYKTFFFDDGDAGSECPRYSWYSKIVLPQDSATAALQKRFGKHLEVGFTEMVVVPADASVAPLNAIFPKLAALAGFVKDNKVPKGWMTFKDGTLRICTGKSKAGPARFKGDTTAFAGEDQHEPEEADGVLFTMELQAESLHHLFCVAEGLLRCL